MPCHAAAVFGRDVSGCGAASSAAGPFYPADERVYIDLSFFVNSSFAALRMPAPLAASRRPTWWRTRWATTETLLGILEQFSARATENRACAARGTAGRLFRRGVTHHASRQRTSRPTFDDACCRAVGDDMIRRTGCAGFTHGWPRSAQWFRRGSEAPSSLTPLVAAQAPRREIEEFRDTQAKKVLSPCDRVQIPYAN
jgi:hypothetical protein